MAVHESVLRDAVLELLAPGEAGQLLVDGTLGEGGHTEAFLSRFPHLQAVGIDADQAILAAARERLHPFGDRFRGVRGWFDEVLSESGWAVVVPEGRRPDRILLDLGISMYHYRASERGFSFQGDEALDMRLETGAGDSAADLVNGLPEKELADLISRWGEERYSRRIAAALVRRRGREPFGRAGDLAEEIRRAVPGDYRRGRIHPATRTFQALRIAVNHEMDRLEAVLPAALARLKRGGRMGIITFHSLEDRRVKHFFREQARACICPPEVPVCQCGGRPLVRLVNRKPIVPQPGEIRDNPASRSAKLRVVEKLAETRWEE